MTAVVTEMVQLLISAISSVGQGVASGIGDTLTALFVQTTEGTQHLSTTGGIIVAFGAIALALGICRLCVMFIFSLGSRGL